MKTIIPIIVAMALALASCQSGNTRNGEKYGGTLRINISDIPHIIFPGQVEKRSEQIIVSQVYDGLLKYHPRTLEIIPSVAKSYRISDDGLTYTFLLNGDARFQDDVCFPQKKGRKIVASDFKFSIEQICRNKIVNDRPVTHQAMNIKGIDNFLETTSYVDTASISGIVAQNDSVLVINLIKPDELFVHFLAGSNALIFSHEAFYTYGIFGTAGSGPYSIKYPKSLGAPVELYYNKNYWKKSKQNDQLPYIDTLVFSFITSTQKELYMFKNGMVNVIFGLPTSYLSPFLESNIEDFQSNPPRYIMSSTINLDNGKQFNLTTSDVNGLYINTQNYFDFSEVYLKNPEPHTIVVNDN